ncbi:MAG: zinc ribbon domain-containing protein [Verrucomicrobia bacterium]|nr:zinc ribbon domain-containing protein [Verrucomicrobiota bacterium]MCH8512164.1 zinc ribbon domain-containing protein [Kiritimatiellia bacterium]
MAAPSKNKPWVRCPACGAANDVGRPFCTKCGARMYSGEGPPPLVNQPRKHTLRHALLAMVVSFCVITAVVFTGLVLWPFALSGDVGSPAVAEEMSRTLSLFNHAVENQRFLPAQIVTEAQFNAYARERAERGREMKIDIFPSRIVLVAGEPFLGLTVTTRVVLTRENRGDPFSLDGVWWGHLPLPKAAARSKTLALARRFNIETDPELWDRLQIENAESGRMVVGLRSGRGGE